ncbi:MAG: DUF917 domain-containing protein [Baekduia sp.]
MRLDDLTLPDLARGCGLLGAGGGGDTYVPLTMARRAVAEHGPVTVLDVHELPADGLVMPCGLIGSSLILSERLPSGDEGRVLRDEVQRREGAELVALMAHSIGGANGLVCATWAARLGLPLLDADAVGRTFPSLAQTTTAMAGIPTTPLVLTDGRGNIVALDAGDDAWAERLARRIATSMGGVCAAAVAPISVQDAQRSAILGSVSRAVTCGADPDGLGRVLADGHIGEIEHRADGEAIGVSLTLHAGPRRLRLEAQSEILLALEDGLPRAAVPDILALVDAATGAPLLLEHLRAGQPVRLLLLDGPPVWHEPAGQAIAGLATFGLALTPPAQGDEARDGAR